MKRQRDAEQFCITEGGKLARPQTESDVCQLELLKVFLDRKISFSFQLNHIKEIVIRHEMAEMESGIVYNGPRKRFWLGFNRYDPQNIMNPFDPASTNLGNYCALYCLERIFN